MTQEEECKLSQKLCTNCRNEKCYDCKHNAKYNNSEFSCECKTGFTYCIYSDECIKIGKDINFPIIEKIKTKYCQEGKSLCKECLFDRCIKCYKNANINNLTGQCECVNEYKIINSQCTGKILNNYRF